MLHLQEHGRAFFAVNEIGGSPTPPDDPAYWRNQTLAIPQAQRQLVLALYLLGKQQAAAVLLCCTQCYGEPVLLPEFSAKVGAPLEPPRLATTPTSYTSRRYSGALVLANAWAAGKEGGVPLTAELQPRAGGYVDLYGRRYSTTIQLPPESGAVLLFANKQQ